MTLNFQRIEDEERVKDLAVQIQKARKERNAILYKLMDTTDPAEAFWRRKQYYGSNRFMEHLIFIKEMLEEVLATTPPTYVLTAGVKFGHQ